jgi:hypothetical protein
MYIDWRCVEVIDDIDCFYDLTFPISMYWSMGWIEMKWNEKKSSFRFQSFLPANSFWCFFLTIVLSVIPNYSAMSSLCLSSAVLQPLTAIRNSIPPYFRFFPQFFLQQPNRRRPVDMFPTLCGILFSIVWFRNFPSNAHFIIPRLN